MAIVTALFVVMVLYAMVTITVGQAQMNQHLTREAHLKVQAHFLANAALQLFLKQLNETPGWEAAHVGEAQADEPAFETGQVKVWIDPIDTERLRVKARADVGGVVVTSTSVVKKRHPVDEMTFARKEINNNPDGIYRRVGKNGLWENLPPPPATYWTGDPSSGYTPETATYGGGEPKYVDKLLEVEGDADGNLYGIWRRGPADEIVRFVQGEYDPTLPPADQARAWHTLPPVPNIVYNSSGVGYDRGNRPDNLELLAVGENALFVVNQRDGIDTIFRMDLAALNDADPTNDTWTTLPPMPKRIYKDDGTLKPVDGFAGSAKDITADRYGNVYVRFPVDDHPDTIFKYDAAGGAWKYLPPAPKKYYVTDSFSILGDEYRFLVLEDAGARKFASNLINLSADPDGILYARFKRDGLDTIFKFTPGAKPAAWNRAGDFRNAWYRDPTIEGGTWIPLQPPPRIYYDRDGNKHVESYSTRRVIDPFTGEARVIYTIGAVAGDLTRTAVDKRGGYLAQWPVDNKPDTLFRFDVKARKWDAQKPVAQKRFRVDGATNQLTEVDDGVLVNGFKSLGGGGHTYWSEWEYDIRATFP